MTLDEEAKLAIFRNNLWPYNHNKNHIPKLEKFSSNQFSIDDMT